MIADLFKLHIYENHYRFLIINLGNSLQLYIGVHITSFSLIPEFIPSLCHCKIWLNWMSDIRIEVSDMKFWPCNFDL